MFQMSKLKEHLLKHFQIKTKEELMNILYGPNFKKSYIPFFTKFLADVRGFFFSFFIHINIRFGWSLGPFEIFLAFGNYFFAYRVLTYATDI